MKRTKLGTVDRFIRKNPLASAKVVAKATGCHLTTVYASRKRLNMPTRMKDQKALMLDKPVIAPVMVAVAKKEEPSTQELMTLRDKLEFANTVTKAICAAVVVLAFVGFLYLTK